MSRNLYVLLLRRYLLDYVAFMEGCFVRTPVQNSSAIILSTEFLLSVKTATSLSLNSPLIAYNCSCLHPFAFIPPLEGLTGAVYGETWPDLYIALSAGVL